MGCARQTPKETETLEDHPCTAAPIAGRHPITVPIIGYIGRAE
jgi:hypothetical protein